MKQKKAFIHVVEIVIITLVVFILVVQFSSVPRPRADWERTSLLALGSDTLAALGGKGINWLDSSQVTQEMTAILGGTSIMYDVTVRNALRSNISVGCICYSSQVDDLNNNLTDFTINGERVEFTVYRIDPTRISFPVVYDVIVLGDAAFTPGRLDPYVTEMKNYLSRDRGLVEMQDFTSQRQVDLSPTQTGVFKLKWGGPGHTSSPLSLATSAGDRFWNLENYFHSITNSTSDTYPKPYSFPYSAMLSSGINVNSSTWDDRIILRQGQSGAAALIVNDGVVDGFGRTAWMAKGDDSREDRWVLIRDVIAWAAGEEYNVVPGAMATPIASSLFTAIPRSNSYSGIGMYQPIEVVISLGYIF